MQQLRYADELLSIGEVPLGEAKVKDSELKLALQIIEQGVSDVFKPEGYEDDVRKRTVALIEQKIAGREIAEGPAEEPKAKVIDLMEALKASLVKREGRKPAQRSGRRTTKKAVAKKSRG